MTAEITRPRSALDNPVMSAGSSLAGQDAPSQEALAGERRRRAEAHGSARKTVASRCPASPGCHQVIPRPSIRSGIDRDAEEPGCGICPRRDRLETDPGNLEQASPVRRKDGHSMQDDLVEPLELRAEDRGRQVRQAEVVSNDREPIPSRRIDALSSELAGMSLELIVVQGDGATLTGRDDLVAIERERADRPDAPNGRPRHRAPWASAASSTIQSPRLSATAFKASMSAGWP